MINASTLVKLAVLTGALTLSVLCTGCGGGLASLQGLANAALDDNGGLRDSGAGRQNGSGGGSTDDNPGRSGDDNPGRSGDDSPGHDAGDDNGGDRDRGRGSDD